MYRISKAETGKRIRRLMHEKGVTVREIQEELDLESPQAVYKWLNGHALPSMENLLILSKLLRIPMESVIAVEQQDEYEKERILQWEKKHPPVFISYRLWETDSIRKADAKRISLLIEDLVNERKRIVQCTN